MKLLTPGRPVTKIKVKPQEVVVAFSEVLNGKPISPHYKPINKKILFSLDNNNKPLILEVDELDQVKFRDHEYLYYCLLEYFIKECGFINSVPMTKHHYKLAIDYAAANADKVSLDSIAPVLQKSRPGLTFKRLSFDIEPGPYPTWQEFLSRTTNAVALCKWIGSLFFPNADLQQYLWIYGEGRNGKGSIARAIERIFGDKATAQQPPVKGGERFWAHGLLEKRLCMFLDCEDYKFISSGFFKSLTGGDSQRIEIKNGGVFSARLICKYLFTSNKKPMISSQEADLRRAIYCESSKVTKEFGPDYEDMLWSEMPYFLYHCVTLYRDTCEDKKPIPVDRTNLEQLAQDSEEYFQYLFDKAFCAVEKTEFLMQLDKTQRPYVTANRFQEYCSDQKLGQPLTRAFREWIIRRYSVEPASIGKRNQRVFFWIKEDFKTASE